jgi:dihydroorotate dehydrogenase electron transfer subunit
MLREIAGFSKACGLEGQAALETHMGCGIGACLSCAVPLRPEAVRRSAAWPKPALQVDEPGKAVHSLICRDGPVYDLQEVDWDAWCA